MSISEKNEKICKQRSKVNVIVLHCLLKKIEKLRTNKKVEIIRRIY